MAKKKKKSTQNITGPVHNLPKDLRDAISLKPSIKKAWDDLTPLARNEWICWVISAKKEETRIKRIKRAQEELLAGKKRPCCWPGCPHRRPSAAKWFKNNAMWCQIKLFRLGPMSKPSIPINYLASFVVCHLFCAKGRPEWGSAKKLLRCSGWSSLGWRRLTRI